jgi:hypothetical protein
MEISKLDPRKKVLGADFDGRIVTDYIHPHSVSTDIPTAVIPPPSISESFWFSILKFALETTCQKHEL